MRTLELNSELNLFGQIDLNSVKIALERDEMEEIVGGYCSGANVNSCIASAYTDNGWTSVALWITSAAIWQTTAAIALACAARNGC